MMAKEDAFEAIPVVKGQHFLSAPATLLKDVC